VPDIAADADPNTGALVYVAQVPLQVGGTSLSAPIMAGLTALANSGRFANSKRALGLLNPRLYQLGQANFRDIIVGNNGAYDAGAGYDLVTGKGAPRMNVLYNSLQKKK
jgi:subtilase family serine protease